MSALPSALASRARRSIIDDATQGLGSSRGPHISLRGGRFRLISAQGDEKLLDTHFMDVVVVDASRVASRVYFEGAYVPDSDVPPACFSDNGTGPSTMALSPQAETCAVCPRNVRGTKQTFTGKPTTACENRKKLAVIMPDDPAVVVYEFQIPPGSLGALSAYTGFIKNQATGVEGRRADIADFVTRVSFDPDRQFVLKFEAAAWADDERTMQLIEYIDANALADQAVGRNDVACAPEQVRAMLAGNKPAPQIAAPESREQTNQFTLPPRNPQPALNQPAAAPAPASPPAAMPAPRGRKPKETQALPPANGAASSPPPAADDGIPAFLRRAPEATQASPVAAPPPRFGVGTPPAPPAEIADALSKAMALPTRRA